METILVLAGGGSRGLLSVQALKYVERYLGRPISEGFQGVYGTSTGAIQAAALTRPDPVFAADLERLYEALCGKVFIPRRLSLGGFAGPQYDGAALARELRGVLGAYQVQDTVVPLGVVTYDLVTRQPVMLTRETAPDWTLAGATLASSSAPTFFDPYRERYVDGGLVANLPSAWAAITHARARGLALSEVRVLAVGTGTTEAPIVGASGRGKIGWVEDVIDIGISGSQDLEALMCEALGLGDYLQLQMAIPAEAAAMDDTSPEQVLRLKQLGNQMVAQQLPSLHRFLDAMSKLR